jgi:hypothetical protein
MPGEQAENIIDVADHAADDGQKRQRSTIEFPYGDLDDAVEFAKAIRAVGGHSCGIDQVAGHLKQAPTSGAFRMRLSFPRIFGLTENERGTVRLTELGKRIVESDKEADARIDAFLHVPLYKAIFEKYKGYTLPPAAALEREMANLGVSTKQTDKARQAFERSAKQANFNWAGPDRLVMPVLKDKGGAASAPDTKPLDPGTAGSDPEGTKKGGGGGKEPPDRDELMRMLLRFLPSEGLDNAQLARWLRAAEVNLRMAYNIDGSIKIDPDPK